MAHRKLQAENGQLEVTGYQLLPRKYRKREMETALCAGTAKSISRKCHQRSGLRVFQKLPQARR